MNDGIGNPEACRIIKVLVYVVGIISPSESESGTAGGTVAGVLCCPCRTMVSPSVAGSGLLVLLGGILTRAIWWETKDSQVRG